MADQGAGPKVRRLGVQYERPTRVPGRYPLHLAEQRQPFHIGTIQPLISAVELDYVSQFINETRRTTRSIDLSWNLPGHRGPIRRQVTKDDGSVEWQESQWHAGPLGLGIIFTDTSGVRWERTLDGILDERASDYAAGDGFVMPLDARLGDEEDYFV